MLASWESESRDTDETIRQLYAQEANLRSGSRSTSSALSSSSSSRATPFSATPQGSSTNTDTNMAGSRGSMRKKASDETIACSIAFHNSERARARVNLFETVPTEVLCVILGWVVEPIGKKMSATDDGDGLRIGNPLLYWHLNPDRTLLRLVCRSWNQTIVFMAREIHVKLGSDESMVKLLETEERRRTRPVTLTRTTVVQATKSTRTAAATATSFETVGSTLACYTTRYVINDTILIVALNPYQNHPSFTGDLS
ncbi:hypothetical protein KI688_002951 [Linnemannia hyalina]|uniref:F-box domain-containing protein n=1 Tax=Linnemannia hyalina TaxID=64524 RepID=A0A9P8BT77_9FUNG|nr:hypothetical protein KI688_002951 [Linnemannia hyalina]